ncbi:hypothetical protein UlMin_013338 [Ulmus minor]
MKTHFTFFWGRKTTEIFFPNWPGQSFESYILALFFVFILCLVVEWLSQARLIKPSWDNYKAGLVQSFMYGIRVGLAYLVMLAVMSFDVGIILVAVAGYSVGFLVFGSHMFTGSKIVPDLPPLNC